MSYDLPRVILLDSDTIAGTSFICGFVSLSKGNTNGINTGNFYLSENGNLPYILYSENEKVNNSSPVQSLPPYIFTGDMPKELDVIFENQVGKKSPKIKVTATMGHPNDDLPVLYKPRTFILCDSLENGEGDATLSYGFLIDLYEGDQLVYDQSDPEIRIVSVDSSKQISKNIDTYIFLFPISNVIDFFTLNLMAQGQGVSTVYFAKAPEYYTIDQ
jgi:hypothetical protein